MVYTNIFCTIIPKNNKLIKTRIENQIDFFKLVEYEIKFMLNVTTKISIKYTRLNIRSCFKGIAIYENNPDILLNENNSPKVSPNITTFFI